MQSKRVEVPNKSLELLN